MRREAWKEISQHRITLRQSIHPSQGGTGAQLGEQHCPFTAHRASTRLSCRQEPLVRSWPTPVGSATLRVTPTELICGWNTPLNPKIPTPDSVVYWGSFSPEQALWQWAVLGNKWGKSASHLSSAEPVPVSHFSSLILFREVGPCSPCRFGRYFLSKRRPCCTATPWPSKLHQTQKQHQITLHQITRCRSPCATQLSCCSKEFKFISPVGFFFPTCAATSRVLVPVWAQLGAEMGLGSRNCWARVSPPLCRVLLGPSLSTGQGNAWMLLWNTSEDGFVPQADHDSLDLLWRHPGSVPSWWIRGGWAAKSTKHQRKWSCSHGTHFALWPQKRFTRASLWRARQWGVEGSPAAAHLSQAGLYLLCSTKQNVSK